MNDNDKCCQSESRPMQAKELTKFDECPLEEKVKRLHLIIKDLRRSLEFCYQADSNLATRVYALEHHQHSVSGECMIKIDEANRSANQIMGAGISNTHDLLA